MVPLRGSPYTASFSADTKPDANSLTGTTLPKYVTKVIEQSQSWMKESSVAANTKDKDLTDIKQLINVVDSVNAVHERSDSMMLQLDQLEETLNFLQSKNIAKESQIKTCKKLFDEWNNLKKLAKDIKKEVAPLVATETQRNTNQIAKLEEDMKIFGQELKKRDFYKYDCGREAALQKLDSVYQEVAELEEKITNYGHTAAKFGKPDIIEGCNKQADSIRNEMSNMKKLWDHISLCQNTYITYLGNTWQNTEPTEMEDEVKKLTKILKDMKVDKRANAYNGILEENKKWLIFLPLIGELRSPSMRERHWDMIRAKVKSNFRVDDKLTLNDVYALNLQNYKEDVEEVTDQANQEAKMEKNLVKLEENWKDIKFEFTQHKNTDVYTIKLSDDNFDLLENDTNMASSM